METAARVQDYGNGAHLTAILNKEAGYKRKGNWPIFRDLLALGNGYNY